MFTEIEQPKNGWSLLQRSQELAQLERFLDHVEHQTPTRQIVLAGAAGTGRTALLNEMARRLTSRGQMVGSARVSGPDGLARATVAAFDEAVRALITKRPGAPALARMQKAVNAFDEATRDAGLHPEDLANAIDRLLPALSFDRDELPFGYMVTIDDIQRADPGQVAAFLEGLMAMAVTGAPVAVIVSASDELDVSAMVSDPANLEIVSLRTFDHAALRSILASMGVSMVDGGVRRLEELSHGLASDLFPLINELSLRQGTLGAGDVEEAMAVLRSDARETGSNATLSAQSDANRPSWSDGASLSVDRSEVIPVSALMIEAALRDDFVVPPSPSEEVVEATVFPFVLRSLPVSEEISESSDMSAPPAPFPWSVARDDTTSTEPSSTEAESSGTSNQMESSELPAVRTVPVAYTPAPEPLTFEDGIGYQFDDDPDLLMDASDLDDVVLDDDDDDDEGVDRRDGAHHIDPNAARASKPSAMAELSTIQHAPVGPLVVSGSQRRVLRTVADLRENAIQVTVDAVRRSVGDLNRFTGVSPVVTAIDELVAFGLVVRRGDGLLELSSAGVTAMLASA